MNNGECPRQKRVLLVLCISLLLYCNIIYGARFFPPGIHWKHVETTRATFLYPDHLESVLPEVLEEFHRSWVFLARYLKPPDEKVFVILTDHIDRPNGFTTLFPRPTIVLYIREPGLDGTLGYRQGWLRTLIVHELVHLFHLESGHAFYRVLRKIFGQNPIGFPHLIDPDWFTEGLAVFFESVYTDAGRATSTDTIRYLMVPPSTLHRPGDFWLVRTTWPGGFSPYHYGGFFFMKLWSTTDREQFKKSLQQKLDAFFPFFMNGKEKGRLGKLYREIWKDSITEMTQTLRHPPHVETLYEGYRIESLRYRKGEICFSDFSIDFFPGIFCVPEEGGKKKRIFAGIPAGWFEYDGNTFLIPNLEWHKTYALKLNLLKTNPNGRQTFDLSIRDVSRFGKGRYIGLTYDESGELQYVLVDVMENSQEKVVHTGFTPGHPVWIEGTEFWASIEKTNALMYCLSFFRRKTFLFSILCDSRRKRDLSWDHKDRSLLFVMEEDGFETVYRLAFLPGWEENISHELCEENGLDTVFEFEKIEPPAYGIRFPVHVNRGIVGVFPSSRGEYIGLIRMPQWVQKGERLQCFSEGIEPSSSPQHPTMPFASSYSIRPVIFPFTWFPTFELDKSGLTRTHLLFIGEDILGYSGYTLDLAWDILTTDFVYDFIYRIDFWYPTFYFRMRKDSVLLDPQTTYTEKEQSIHALFPFRKIRWDFYIYGGFRRRTAYIWQSSTHARASRRDYELYAGQYYTRAYRYQGSLSIEEGFWFQTEVHWGVGQSRYMTLDAEVAFYIPLFAHHVLVLHSKGAISFGPEKEFLTIGDREGDVTPFRGTRQIPILVDRGIVLNLAYRFPVKEFDRAFGEWPLFIHRMGFSLYVDVVTFRRHPEYHLENAVRTTQVALGVENIWNLSLRGFGMIDLRAGISIPLHETQNRRWYIHLGYGF